MSVPLNLNQARKARARKDARQQADENAVSFGRTKAQKQAEKMRHALAAKQLDQHRQDSE